MLSTQTFLLEHTQLMLLLTQPLEMQGGGLNGAFSEGIQYPMAGVQFSFPNRKGGPDQAPLIPLPFPPLGLSGSEAFTWGHLSTQSWGLEGTCEGERVRKTLQKFRDLVKTNKVSEKEYEQIQNTIKNHMSGRKAIKAY